MNNHILSEHFPFRFSFRVVHKTRGKLKPGTLTVGSPTSAEFRTTDSNHILCHSTSGSLNDNNNSTLIKTQNANGISR